MPASDCRITLRASALPVAFAVAGLGETSLLGRRRRRHGWG